jgi:hypothetical protein
MESRVTSIKCIRSKQQPRQALRTDRSNEGEIHEIPTENDSKCSCDTNKYPALLPKYVYSSDKGSLD